jgi:hypothetical protein
VICTLEEPPVPLTAVLLTLPPRPPLDENRVNVFELRIIEVCPPLPPVFPEPEPPAVPPEPIFIVNVSPGITVKFE